MRLYSCEVEMNDQHPFPFWNPYCQEMSRQLWGMVATNEDKSVANPSWLIPSALPIATWFKSREQSLLKEHRKGR